MTTLHLTDANVDVAIALLYGDILAIEKQKNDAIKLDNDTGERLLDGSFITAHRDALLSHIPKQVPYDPQSPRPFGIDAIRALSVKDGRALFDAVSAAYNEAVAMNVEDNPKDSSSKKRSA